MDPLSAIGLAGNLITFVEFAFKVVGTGSEIASSARGATDRTEEDEKVYRTLNDFASKLKPKPNDLSPTENRPQGGPTRTKTIQAHATALEELAIDCGFKSFGAALKTALGAKKREELEKRLTRFQTLIGLHFFPLLLSLNFETRSDRQDNIPEAHKSTFKWVFSDDEPVIALQDERSAEGSAHFRSWLRSGDGTFWILGKPGAGKSTLMKFITSHKKTVRELRRWSGPKGLVIAKHYFWSIGTAMQKSLKGLLQELLYDILCNCPELIPQVFPDRWQEVKPGRLPPTGKWSTETLLEGLTTLVQYPDIRFKFCAFIDGLDEFAGDHVVCQADR
ncbi:putative nacht nucleoside triphosphatase protein [Eutypa lata UCREL1]|uniref:Putative nacht nucleoside triphosphatase protein n=1 Tax=Eutypa lata (strain UCR-EL1) TaxID=1287681 RepID=M7T808_EUTLA|nr:putative nacht nucleoside triphosphatase protein [Eutypa lata UCREL1]